MENVTVGHRYVADHTFFPHVMWFHNCQCGQRRTIGLHRHRSRPRDYRLDEMWCFICGQLKSKHYVLEPKMELEDILAEVI